MKAAKKKSTRVTSTTTQPLEPPAAIRRGDSNESLTVLRACDVLKAYFPKRYGDEIIPLALSILQKKSAPSTVFVKHQLITPRNVDLIYPLDERRSLTKVKLPQHICARRFLKSS